MQPTEPVFPTPWRGLRWCSWTPTCCWTSSRPIRIGSPGRRSSWRATRAGATARRRRQRELRLDSAHAPPPRPAGLHSAPPRQWLYEQRLRRRRVNPPSPHEGRSRRVHSRTSRPTRCEYSDFSVHLVLHKEQKTRGEYRDRSDQTLFVDARKLGRLSDRRPARLLRLGG